VDQSEPSPQKAPLEIHRMNTAPDTMNKATINALERVWVAEIEGRLPLQSRAKIYEKLRNEGLVHPMTTTVAVDRFGPMMISGWELTHAGRFLYCLTCSPPQGE
jgi:hypothetical protein